VLHAHTLFTGQSEREKAYIYGERKKKEIEIKREGGGGVEKGKDAVR
jgi:hypothetical protein